jgi:oxalate decarboxylase
MSRRRTTGSSAAILLSTILALSFQLHAVAASAPANSAPAPGETTKSENASPESSALPEIKYELEKKPLTVYPGGSSHEANATNFPISKGMSGVSMFLKPGALRELHWHANAAEWAYVISGHCRITVIDPEGHTEIKDFGPGDVWYFPRGHGHSIQGIGNEECHFLLVFDSGYFSEYATFSASDWFAQTSPEVLAKNFNMPASSFANFPKKEVYISQGPVPPPLALDPTPESQNPPPLTHRYRLGAKIPLKIDGGTFSYVDTSQFPISKTISGALLKMKAGAMREMHWHPNADEWQYYIGGHARMTVFLSGGKHVTRDFGPGDVGYVPMGCGHYLETIGDTNVEMLAAFNTGHYQEISLTEWLSKTPKLLLETNFGVSPSIIDSIRKGPSIFSDSKYPVNP